MELVAIFAMLWLIIMFFISIAMYVLMSLGIMGLLKGIGDKTPALAFVPYLNTYYLGRIGSKDPSKISKLGIALLVLQILTSIVSFMVGFIVGFVSELKMAEEFIILPMIFMVLVILAYLAVYYVAYSRIFIKYSKNGVLFTVLNILIGGGVLGTIFLFIIRNNKPLEQQNV